MLCAYCGIESRNICSRCKSVSYCGVEHQKEHWKIHKIDCKKLKYLHEKSLESKEIEEKSIKEEEETKEIVRKSCRCMFCGSELVISSEEEAIKHMEVCPALQEQLNDVTNQFTLPESMR